MRLTHIYVLAGAVAFGFMLAVRGNEPGTLLDVVGAVAFCAGYVALKWKASA